MNGLLQRAGRSRSAGANRNGDPFPSRTLVSRLVGLETEYVTALVDRDGPSGGDLPSAKSVYDSLVRAMRRSQPWARGLYDHDRTFLANGACVSFETHPTLQDRPGGLTEVATPEVSGLGDLLAAQRAVDRMMESAAAQNDLDRDLRVFKSSTDGQGNVFGCQENYETDVARGVWLLIYRVCVIGLWLIQIICTLAALPMVAMVVAATVYQGRRGGQQFREDDDAVQSFQSLPHWFTRVSLVMIRGTQWPLAVGVAWIGRHVAFRDQRRYLTALLVSRVSLCGTGHLDPSGRFFLSGKAVAIDRLADLGGYRGERPIFVYGHWFGQLCGKSWDAWWRTWWLLRRRQRLQIGLSDSNLAELPEYLKVGSVSLVLDMIEASQTQRLPILKRPLRSLHAIATDWNLVTRVPTNRGERTALEIQNAYLVAATEFVRQTPANVRGEADRVLQAWKELLDSARRFRRDASDMSQAVAKLDWLTKRWLIDRQGTAASWAAKKKIDLRFHELSDEGYFRQLTLGQIDPTLASPETRHQRNHFPPSNSPAARRSWTIREFSSGGETLRVAWSHAEIGDRKRCRRIAFGNQVF